MVVNALAGISTPLLCVCCRLAGSGAVLSGGTVARPIAPDLVANATNAAVTAAASAIDLSSMEIDVVAVGMGLRFVEIESGNQEVCFAVYTPDIQCIRSKQLQRCAYAAPYVCCFQTHLPEPASAFKCMLRACPIKALLDMGHLNNQFLC